jgi:hypothetical protein
MLIRGDSFPVFWGKNRVGWIASRDIAAVSATVLKEGPAKHHAQNYWPSGTPCSIRACRMDSEKELLDAFDRVVHEDFPNPQRIACPGREVLLKLAQHPADTQLTHLLAHIRQCAPCFGELKELRQEGRIQTR